MTKTAKTPKIEFAKTDRERFKKVNLEWPLIVDGVELNSITVSRLKAKEVAALQEAMAGDGIPEEELLSMFIDQPKELMGELDADDLIAVKEAVFDFLPRTVQEALKAALEIAELQAGASSPQTSPMPSSGDEKTS